MSTAGVLISP